MKLRFLMLAAVLAASQETAFGGTIAPALINPILQISKEHSTASLKFSHESGCGKVWRLKREVKGEGVERILNVTLETHDEDCPTIPTRMEYEVKISDDWGSDKRIILVNQAQFQ